MKRVISCAVFLVLATGCGACGAGSIADLAVIDRDTGVSLPMHFHHGEYWIAGQPGARYAIEIRNRIGERVLAVTSVDGVNVLSGETAAWDQAGYVFGPGERYQITGWRKSDAMVAAFTFTDSPNSYAERTGRPANVGVIGVAIFRERPSQPVYTPPTIGGRAPQSPEELDGTRRYESAAAANESRAKALSGDSPASELAQTPRALAAPKLGTGHGEREYSYVNHTEFARLQSQPNEIIRIHYDSLDNLFAMGIVRRPAPAVPNPFPGSAQYVPDPPGG
jgi:hypothetical protein